MIESKHIKSYCNQCQHDIVKCVTCKNNCCNGGSGQVNGVTCPDYDEAYEHHQMMRSNKDISFFETEEVEKLSREELWASYFPKSKDLN